MIILETQWPDSVWSEYCV